METWFSLSGPIYNIQLYNDFTPKCADIFSQLRRDYIVITDWISSNCKYIYSRGSLTGEFKLFLNNKINFNVSCPLWVTSCINGTVLSHVKRFRENFTFSNDKHGIFLFQIKFWHFYVKRDETRIRNNLILVKYSRCRINWCIATFTGSYSKARIVRKLWHLNVT